MKVWQGEKNENGKRPVLFSPPQSGAQKKLEIPCGKCIGCRLERSRQWAVRCMHEKQMHEDNCFITLTYRPENMPKDGSLNLEDYQKFMKRLRKKHEDKKIRFFQCGEYGENFLRPHHHAIIFGHDFRNDRDGKIYNSSSNGKKLVSSEELEDLWEYGFNTVGDVTFESAAYVARYITKKITGEKALEHYAEIDKATGEIMYKRKPEYITMSRRPGIGKKFYDDFKRDVYPEDEVIVRAMSMKPPKYYDYLLDKEDPEMLKSVKERRMEVSDNIKENRTWERLKVREDVKRRKLEFFNKRSLENVR